VGSLAKKFWRVGFRDEESDEVHRAREGEHDPEQQPPRIAKLPNKTSYSRPNSGTEEAEGSQEMYWASWGFKEDEDRGSA